MAVTAEELEIVIKANIEEATSKIEELKSKLSQTMNNATKPIKQLGQTLNSSGIAQGVNKTSKQMEILAKEIEMQQQKVARLKKEWKASITGPAKQSRSLLEQYKKANIQLDKMNLRYEAMGEEPTKAIGKISDATKKASKSANMLGKTFKRMIISMALGGVIREVINQQDLAQYSTKFNKTMSNLQGSFLTLRNSITTAFAPVLQALEPIITSVTNAIINMFNAIAKFNTALFTTNKTYTKAKQVTTDYAKSVAQTNKGTKGALAGFDELNVISNQQTTSAGTPSATEMFEEAEVDRASILGDIDFTNLTNSLEKLKQALEPFKKDFFSGLDWFWNNILQPLGAFVINDLVPSFFNLLAGALNVLHPILEKIKPIFEWLWNNFLQPIAKWTGGVIVKVINDLANALSKLSDLLEGKTTFKEFWNSLSDGEAILLAIATAVTAVATAIGIYNGVSALATALTTGLGAAVAFLTSPVTLVIAGITALIAIVVLLIKHWDDVKLAASNCWEAIKNVWSNVANWFNEKVIQPIAEFFKAMWDGITSVFKGVVNTIIGFINNMVIDIVLGVNKVISKINNVLLGIARSSTELGFPMVAKLIDPLDMPDMIPKLAKGGVLTEATPIIAGEYAGAKDNPEIVTPQKLMYETSMKANMPVINAVEEMTDKLTEALSNLGVYAEFGYDKLKVGLDAESRRTGKKLFA